MADLFEEGKGWILIQQVRSPRSSTNRRISVIDRLFDEALKGRGAQLTCRIALPLSHPYIDIGGKGIGGTEGLELN